MGELMKHPSGVNKFINEMSHNESLKGKQGSVALNTVTPKAEKSCFTKFNS